jgi:hypothetical protein
MRAVSACTRRTPFSCRLLATLRARGCLHRPPLLSPREHVFDGWFSQWVVRFAEAARELGRRPVSPTRTGDTCCWRGGWRAVGGCAG